MAEHFMCIATNNVLDSAATKHICCLAFIETSSTTVVTPKTYDGGHIASPLPVRPYSPSRMYEKWFPGDIF